MTKDCSELATKHKVAAEKADRISTKLSEQMHGLDNAYPNTDEHKRLKKRLEATHQEWLEAEKAEKAARTAYQKCLNG